MNETETLDGLMTALGSYKGFMTLLREGADKKKLKELLLQQQNVAHVTARALDLSRSDGAATHFALARSFVEALKNPPVVSSRVLASRRKLVESPKGGKPLPMDHLIDTAIATGFINSEMSDVFVILGEIEKLNKIIISERSPAPVNRRVEINQDGISDGKQVVFGKHIVLKLRRLHERKICPEREIVVGARRLLTYILTEELTAGNPDDIRKGAKKLAEGIAIWARNAALEKFAAIDKDAPEWSGNGFKPEFEERLKQLFKKEEPKKSPFSGIKNKDDLRTKLIGRLERMGLLCYKYLEDPGSRTKAQAFLKNAIHKCEIAFKQIDSPVYTGTAPAPMGRGGRD